MTPDPTMSPDVIILLLNSMRDATSRAGHGTIRVHVDTVRDVIRLIETQQRAIASLTSERDALRNVQPLTNPYARH